jgi:ATP-dependent Lhr-like helicase
MALARRARRILGDVVDIQLQTTDDGIMLRLPDLADAPPVHALMGLSPVEAEALVLEEIGSTPLFGARFRMNAARALLLPRGSPSRRMPLWLQRLKAGDLLEAVRPFPSFPILVETYREVLQDAFDMEALGATLRALATGQIAVRVVATERPSPFALGLQFGFVMDWMYADDTPRAERAAALLTIDRQLLDDVMGTAVSDVETRQALESVVAERRGTTARRQARSADELAQHLERAGDLSADELRARIAPIEMRQSSDDPFEQLIAAARAIEMSEAGWTPTPRYVLAEDRALYGAAANGDRPARREILARHLQVAGPVTISDIVARYGWPEAWIESRLVEWQRTVKLVRGVFQGAEAQWCVRRLVDVARRRALAAMRAAIEPTDLATFAAFLQRWQHVDPRDRLTGEAGLAAVLDQLDGLARPAEGWERDYLPARLEAYDHQWIARLAAAGGLVWAGAPRAPDDAPATLATVRFVQRGEGAIWLGDVATGAPLTDRAVRVRDALAQAGASFIADIETLTGLGPLAVRDALRELVAAGLVTNDTVEALREVVRTRTLPTQRGATEPDPTRWLPSTFTPSPGRRDRWARPGVRRLPRWRRPDRPGASAPASWIGRWSLLAAGGTLGGRPPAEEHAAIVARQWLARYGIVTLIDWRAIYHELKRMEYRGEVRRGYFVAGLGGAQFAHPDAVERLRAIRDDSDAPFVAFAASDPANPYSLALPGVERDPLSRPRGRGGILVTRRGVVQLMAEGRGRRITLAPELSVQDGDGARAALAAYLARR